MSKATDMAHLHGMRDGYAIGRREMLWLMAVGAVCAVAIYDEAGRWTRADMARGHSTAALLALADLGDEQAREMLR